MVFLTRVSSVNECVFLNTCLILFEMSTSASVLFTVFGAVYI